LEQVPHVHYVNVDQYYSRTKSGGGSMEDFRKRSFENFNTFA
jgi:hypothetical protein